MRAAVQAGVGAAVGVGLSGCVDKSACLSGGHHRHGYGTGSNDGADHRRFR